jgi:hypothetical protein
MKAFDMWRADKTHKWEMVECEKCGRGYIEGQES